MVIMGIVLVLMETIMYWWDVKSYGKMPKRHTKRNFVWFYWKSEFHNGILMETIGISVMVSIGVFFSKGGT